MTRNVKLCISLLLALFLIFTVTIGVLADPEEESSTDSDSSAESSEESSESSSSEPPSNLRTVTVRGEHVKVYFNDSAAPSTQIQVEPGSSLTLRVVADPGYLVQGVTMNGLPLPGSAGIYTLSSVMSDCILVVDVIPDGTTEPSDSSDPSNSSDPSDSSDPSMDEEVEIYVTIHGAGSVSVDGTLVSNDGNGTITQSVWVHVTDPSGKRVQFNITPATGYRLKTLAYDGLSRELRSSFPLQITDRTTMEITFVSEEEMPATFPVTIRVSEGGYVSANGQEILGGSTNTLNVPAGGSVNLWLNASAGFELDALLVDGSAENIKSGSFTLQNIAKAVEINVTFKQKATVNPVQAADFAWTPDSEGNIKLDLTSNDLIGKSVFDKINTLSDADGDYVVLMTQYVRWYIPCGKRIEGVTGDFRLSVATGANASYYEKIKTALESDSDPDNDLFNFYQLFEEPSFPDGTKVSFQMMSLADMYSGNAVDLLARVNKSGQFVLEPAGAGSIGPDGWTTQMNFLNSAYQVVIVQPSSEQPDVTSSVPSQSSSFSFSENEEPAGKSYAGLIVALIIAFVAVGGAAALFIVKWRQEKF